MRKAGGGRNFGWDKQMEWAGKQALRAALDGGHYGTVASHAARWRSFCQWARERGVRDVRQLTGSELARFAAHLRRQTEQGMSIGYAKNQLTSVNVALESLRGDRALWVKPGDFLGHRPGIRAQAPVAVERRELKPVDRSSFRRRSGAGCRGGASLPGIGLTAQGGLSSGPQACSASGEHSGQGQYHGGYEGRRGRGADRWVPAGRDAVRAIELAPPSACCFAPGAN